MDAMTFEGAAQKKGAPVAFHTKRRGISKSFCYPCSPRQLKAALTEWAERGKPVFERLEFETAYDQALSGRLPGILAAIGDAYLLRGEPELKETTPVLNPWMRLHAVRNQQWSEPLTEEFLTQALPGMISWLDSVAALPETARTGRHQIAAVLEGKHLTLHTIRAPFGTTTGASFEIHRY
ncbi:MAG: hypothetical protein IT210_01145 [Armatimonadetes bacterium]|nr:hypothetical protein [Armatimonadota bacterium]